MPTPSTSGRRLVALLAVLTALLAGSLVAPPAGAATAANQAYVRSLYTDILDRPTTGSDSSGIDFWANRLETTPRARVVRQIMFAPRSEYFRFQVELLFNLYLERSADPSGFSYYTSQWQSGKRSREDIIATLAASNEFYNRAGGTLDAFVTRAYFDILGREPDANGRAYFKNVATTRGRASVARILLFSGEALRDEVDYKYTNFLERPPTAGELSSTVDARRNGLRFEDVDVALVSSSEYYAAKSAG